MREDNLPQSGSNGYCHSCGEPHAVDGAYCTSCGASSTATAGEPSSPLFSPWVLVSGAVALLAIAIMAVVIAFGGRDDAVEASSEVTTTPVAAATTLPTSTTEAVAPVLDLDEKELADSFGNAVFKITTDGCDFVGIGTGFAIDESHIVTNRHVVENDTTPKIVGRDGSVYDGRVVGWREDPDMAVIRVNGELDTYLEWADSDQLSEGERTVSFGYPLPDHDFSVAPGVVLSFDDDRGHREAIRSDAQLDKGNSGGPTLLADGRVAGVVTAMDLNLSGFQFVPIIIPSNDIVEKVDWILEHPSRPTVDCDEVLAALEPETPATTTTVAPPPPPPPPAAPETFYSVIMASPQQRNASFEAAMATAQQLADKFGGTMYVIDSNAYSSLTPGLWVVHVGALSRSDALSLAESYRNQGYDFFAKRFSG